MHAHYIESNIIREENEKWRLLVTLRCEEIKIPMDLEVHVWGHSL